MYHKPDVQNIIKGMMQNENRLIKSWKKVYQVVVSAKKIKQK